MDKVKVKGIWYHGNNTVWSMTVIGFLFGYLLGYLNAWSSAIFFLTMIIIILYLINKDGTEVKT